MTATNHALSGAVIGLSITHPAIALPLAFASHFVLDVVPHFGLEKFTGYWKQKELFRKFILTDALLLCLFFVFLLFAKAPLLVFACVFLACLPDTAWAYRYIFYDKFGRLKPRPMNRFNKWHVDIQTHSLKGIYLEVSFALLMFSYIASKLV